MTSHKSLKLTTVLCALIGTATVFKARVASKMPYSRVVEFAVLTLKVTPDATSEGSPRMMIIIFLVWSTHVYP